MNVAISIKNLSKVYNGTEVFRDFNLDIEKGKISVIFGPNGCGKSSLLNILSGTIPIEEGHYSIENFNHFQFSYIFQNYRESLLPWRNNYKNVSLPLDIQEQSSEVIRKRIEELQELFEFKFNWKSYPYELSGGQQQILAFLRALVTNPQLIFIDEPFSALDYENNLRFRNNLQKYYVTHSPTILLITHNIEEAVHLGEKIIVLSQKPSTVLKVVDNPSTYPRSLEFLKTEVFHQIKDEVLSTFQQAAKL